VSVLAAALLPLASTSSTSWMMYAGIGAVGLGLLGLLILLVPFERTLSTEERVQQYAARAGSGAPASAPVTVSSSRPQESPLQQAKDAAASALSHNVGLEQ
jgi:tight adherence protein B